MPSSPWIRFAISVTCLVFGLALGRLLVGALLDGLTEGPVPVPQVDATWDCLEAARDRIDTVVVGSSLTWRHVEPDSFAEGASSRGVPLRPYTLGVQGMTVFEQVRLVDRLLENPHGSLRVIVLEARPVAVMGWDNAFTDRAMRGAVWDEMHAAVGFHLASEERLKKRVDRALPFAVGWAARSTDTGRLSAVLMPPLDVPTESEAARGCAQDGFFPLEWSEEQDVRARREAFLADERPWSVDVEPAERPDDVWIELYAALVGRVTDAGLTCIVYVPPSVLQLEPLRGLASVADEAFAGAPVVSFLPEDLGASLYTRDVRFDREHLLLPAARELSRTLGASVADALRAEGR